MKKIMCLFAILFAVSLVSCGSGSSGKTENQTPTTPGATNESEAFGITGISMSIKSASVPDHRISKDSADGAYVTWETWMENSIWTLPWQGGSYTAWEIKTPITTDGDQVTQIVGLAQTCVATDIDRETGTEGIYTTYFGDDYFYLAVRGTLHMPDGTTKTSEYREAVPITDEIRDYIDHEVMLKDAGTFVDRMSLTLHFTVDQSAL